MIKPSSVLPVSAWQNQSPLGFKYMLEPCRCRLAKLHCLVGLVNQLYSHIAALALAAHLGAEVILPPAAKRDSFEHYFSVFKERNEVLWSAGPLESLLDVDHLISFWAKRGMTILRVSRNHFNACFLKLRLVLKPEVLKLARVYLQLLRFLALI